ncbi:MAG: glycerate kinase [Geminocystis sp.]|nr:glycerate kinase [Geminocystis sp.]HIK38232.1 glycerate kinase [Geminocystis sp. M7585_C2015_104]MCS7149073.1 glycerate kinase [Geminocystis sp.]MCX8078128.1 glycerate kinase [Geminocystis sp.]MDW8117150.1 glycerate kinase [Geminocystis sp.]
MMNLRLVDIIKKLVNSIPISQAEEKILISYKTGDNYAFNEEAYPDLYNKKKEVITGVYSEIWQKLEEWRLDKNEAELIHNLWGLWLPLAWELLTLYKQQSTPLVLGILGLQGTGKTTTARILSLIWEYLGLSTVAISLDDFYKTYAQRRILAQIEPRLIWRGPPATHDVSLAIEVVTSLKQRQYPVSIPRFDKSLHQGRGDRAFYEQVNRGDIIILEGWFVGVRPVPEEVFDNPPHPIITPEDRQFALDCNKRLEEYLPLWEMIDYLLVFNPEDYRYSLKWRQEAERKMRLEGKTGMTDREVEEFVHYFWKALHPQIFLPPLINNPQLTHLVVNLDICRRVTAVYKPLFK